MSDTQDFNALRNNLKHLKLQKLFIDFTENIMGMSPDDERTVLLSNSYMQTVTQLANENVLLHDRLHNFINSDFLYTLLTYKNLRYEREIKKFLKHLNTLLVTTSKEGETRDFKTLEHFFNSSILGALEIIEPDEAENREQIVTMIVDAIAQPFRPVNG